MTDYIDRPETKILLPGDRTWEQVMKPRDQSVAHLKMLHNDTEDLVELAAGSRDKDGRLRVFTRENPSYFLPGGAAGLELWRDDIMQLVDSHSLAGDEMFVGPTARTYAQGTKAAVTSSNWLWVDIDNPQRLDALWGFLKAKPCHMLVRTGGSGGVHAYWKLSKPLRIDTEVNGKSIDWLDRAHKRIIWHLGTDEHDKPNVADPVARDRSRILRLAGTVNGKTGRHAQLMFLDARNEGWGISDLVGDLPDPSSWTPRSATPRPPRNGDEWQTIPADQYWSALTGTEPTESGWARCPNPAHDDTNPSCRVGGGASPQAWFCHSCGAGGGLVQLASVVNGGPHSGLRGAEFKRSLQFALDRLGLKPAG